MIIGSMAFSKDMIAAKKELEKLGHLVDVPWGIEDHLKDKKFVDNLDENYEWCIKTNVMKKCFDLVADADAVLIVNKKRKGIEGYIGVSAFMELGIAHHLNKKIFLLNRIPSWKRQRWSHEVSIMQPVIINEDLSKIK